MRNLAGVIAGIALTAAAVAPAAAATAEPDPWVPIFTKERVYHHCDGAKVGNVTPKVFPWNTTAPTASFTTGAGCGHLDSDKLSGDHVTFEGKHFGNLDRLTVHAYVIDAGPVRAGAYPEIWADVTLTVDGEPLVGGFEAHLTPIPTSTGLARLLEFSVIDMGLVEEEDYIEHDVELMLETSSYLDGDQIAWVLDASEVRSGITFSPDALASTVISVLG